MNFYILEGQKCECRDFILEILLTTENHKLSNIWY